MAEFAISVPQLVADGTFDRDALRAYLVRAEELGFTGAWVTEQVIGSAPNLDSNVLLALAAAYTERIRLGCAVYVSTLASPLHLAKAIATLDQVSGGRLEVAPNEPQGLSVRLLLPAAGQPAPAQEPVRV